MELKEVLGVVITVGLAWYAHAAVTCDGPGRFADPADTTCQRYTLCVYDASTAGFLSYNYTCPSTSVFNPETARCTDSSNYECVAPAANETSICTADGYIPDPDAVNCTTYIECVEVNGTFIENPLNCPPASFFNPTSGLCEGTYVCPTTAAFSCTAPGRFADTTDPSCQAYFLCVPLLNGTLTHYSYTCPSTSVFNPGTSLCTSNYNCAG
ncbi:hypothetical protein JYU34_009561 [Plutella xylostella]|uniref:Chitin-binding type-2 domain-containing protein n=1 Tax=Plutella xylostella TaxID=51655 RepID=A0ABQ7QJV1_PLUXY|nr:hypothetical protein JYU34_009561 [Plutella xylostella]